MERVVVTGAHGFIGRHVARALAAAGKHVVGIGHGSWGRDEWREWGLQEWHTADVSLEALSTYAGHPAALIHCAGSGSVSYSLANPYQDWQRTVSSTLAVLEFVRLRCADARIVFPSSAGVYGVARLMPIGVTAPLAPASPYGVHKMMAEKLCGSYALHFGLRTAVVRLFSVYGVGLRKQLLWDACMKLQRGDGTFEGTGEETRDWLHVEDAAQLMIMAAQHASDTCPVVNGGTGQATSIRQVVELLAQCVSPGTIPVFSGRLRAGDPAHYVSDLQEAERFGWKPSRERVDMMREYAFWFLRDAP